MDAENTEVTAAPTHTKTIVTFAVLSGLTLLVPVPFVDDYLCGRVRQRMVKALVDGHTAKLDERDIASLLHGKSKPLLKRVAGAVVTYPLKKIFRKTFMVLAGKEAIDTVSQTYHLGYLIDFALAQRWHDARTAAQIGVAIESACEEIGTSPVNHAIRSAFERSRSLVTVATGNFVERVKRRFDRRAEARTADDEAPEITPADAETPEMKSLVDQVITAMSNVPAEHFAKLTERVATRLDLARG
jgi:uncharacterized protein (DUF697 family)